MSEPFTRTPGGLAASWRFFDLPTIWVEGPTDIYFYSPLIAGKQFRIQPFHGAENGAALINALTEQDSPYIVVVDGDYSVLSPSRSKHRRLITLARYSCENYLWEEAPLNEACLRHARCGERKNVVRAEMQRIETHLRKELEAALALDIAARRMDPAPAVLPDRLEPLLIDHRRVELDTGRIKAICRQAKKEVDPTLLQQAAKSLKAFLASRSIAHVLDGHVLFGALRRLFHSLAAQENETATVLNNDALMQLLSSAVWQTVPSDDHRSLKRKLYLATKEVSATFPKMKR